MNKLPDIRERVRLRFPKFDRITVDRVTDLIKAILLEYDMDRSEFERRITALENKVVTKENVKDVVDEKLQAELSRMKILAGNAPKDG